MNALRFMKIDYRITKTQTKLFLICGSGNIYSCKK